MEPTVRIGWSRSDFRQKGVRMRKYKQRIAVSMLAIAPFLALASDHLEAPLVESDQAADIADVYTFVDPNDNSKVILALDVHGFIVPGFLRGRILSRKARWISRFHSANLRSSCAFPARKLWSQTHS